MDLMAAIIGNVMALVFLGWLVVTIGAPPLVIVIVIGVALMLADTFGSLRKRENNNH